MEQLLNKFYDSFHDLDAEAMTACYHPNIVFEDPAFGILIGDRAKNMWKMLLASQKGKKFDISHEIVYVNNKEGRVNWEAKYVFSKTGRNVHNRISAHFKFKDGLIIDHRDHFNLHHWAAMAMGWKGRLIGGTSFFKKKLQSQTNNMLNKFLA
jgi:ketosteroid isomerase-like protein